MNFNLLATRRIANVPKHVDYFCERLVDVTPKLREGAVTNIFNLRESLNRREWPRNVCQQFKNSGLAILALLFAGCSSSDLKQWEPEQKRYAYTIASRQLAPEPVYNRARWVMPPEPLPSHELPSVTGPQISPVIHFKLANTPLEEAAKILASAARYSSYCASSIAHQRISIDKLGTIDELASAIESQAGIAAVVDHDNRSIRFLAGRSVAPSLYEGSAVNEGSLSGSPT